MSTPTPITPAGWYPDPWGSPTERWWDGTAWTSTTRSPAPDQAPGLPRSAGPAQKAPRDPMWTSQKVLIGVILVALVVAGIGMFRVGRSAFGTLMAEQVATPAVITRELDAGKYTIFERIGTQNSVGPVTYSQTEEFSIGPDDLEITGPDGESVPTEIWSVDETLQRGDALYAGAAGFTAERPGTYRIDIGGPASEVVVGRRLFDGTATALVTMAVGAVTGCIAVIAFITIVLVRSSRRKALR